MAALKGEEVDRPPVSFYELNGLDEDPLDGDPFNIYSHPSWRPLIDLTREATDRIVMREVPFIGAPADPVEELAVTETSEVGESRLTTRTVSAGGRILTSRTRRDRDVNTVWQVEHLLKDLRDLEAWLELPRPAFGGEPDPAGVLEAEARLGDTGIVMIDTPDPLCMAASLFDLGTFTVLALTESARFHRLLESFARILQPRTEAVASRLPGRLWRIYGPEYAAPPYLPPALFREYVVRYDAPLVEAIQRHGGYARMHVHGKLEAILDDLVSTGCTALDPIEPPPQGDVELAWVRRRYGRQLTLFGNLEVSDIENLTAREFESKVVQALEEGTEGKGRGFVLMPSACPYGRVLSGRTMSNYEKIIETVEAW
jgi:hypothetical protein